MACCAWHIAKRQGRAAAAADIVTVNTTTTINKKLVPSVGVGPKRPDKNKNIFLGFNKPKSKSNTHGTKPSNKNNSKHLRNKISKSDAWTLEFKKAKSIKNSDKNSSLKCNSNICSWSRMAKIPTKLLLDDPDVRRWHDNLRRSSALTGS